MAPVQVLTALLAGIAVAKAASSNSLDEAVQVIAEAVSTEAVQEFGNMDDSDYCNNSPKRIVHLPATSANNQTLSLAHVSIVFRHGDRMVWDEKNCWTNISTVFDCDMSALETPAPLNTTDSKIDRIFLKTYDAGPNALKGNCLIGQLTGKGYHQEVLNGRALKKAYVNTGFLPKKFDPAKVWLRSDNDQRTLQSLEAMMEGLYPASSKGNESEVVTIHSMEMLKDPINLSTDLCAKSVEYETSWKLSPKYILHNALVNTPLRLELSKYTNMSESDIYTDGFADCARILKCWNKETPDWLDDDMYQKLTDEYYWQNAAWLYYPTRQEAAKVLVGFLIKELVSNMQYHVDPTSINEDKLIPGHDRLLDLISSHDNTLLALLVAFGIDGAKWPKYATLLHLELYYVVSSDSKSTGPTHYVRLIYNGDILPFPFCADYDDDGLCPYDVFAEYVKTVTIASGEEDKEC